MELYSHPFFESVNKEDVKHLSEKTVYCDFEPDVIIFEEGSPSDGIYLVLEGEVAFCKRTEGEQYRTVSYSKEGNFFGEIGLFSGKPRSLRAESRGKVRLAKIVSEDLIHFIKNTAGPVNKILESIIHHLHETTRHYMDDMLQQEKMAVVGSMVSTIIHDFKNPFCMISLSAQMIAQNNSEDAGLKKYCQNIEEQVHRMVVMAEELIEFSKGKQTLHKSTIRLKDLIDRFKELNYPYFQNEDIVINFEFSDVPINAEMHKLLRVLQNLVGNAIDAFEDEKGKIDVIIEVEKKKNLYIRVIDNGNGIPEQIRARFFDPFITYGKSKGTGLGSAIAKSIIEAHGGTIKFESEAGQGTTFFIRMPIVEKE